VTLVNRSDIPKIQRIERLIGYQVPTAPLPSFIAEIHDKRPEHHASSRKPQKGGFKQQRNKKFRRKKTGGENKE
jgi:hypothetical protein